MWTGEPFDQYRKVSTALETSTDDRLDFDIVEHRVPEDFFRK